MNRQIDVQIRDRQISKQEKWKKKKCVKLSCSVHCKDDRRSINLTCKPPSGEQIGRYMDRQIDRQKYIQIDGYIDRYMDIERKKKICF